MNPPNILCVSLSPALDRYITVNNFELGKLSRTTHVDERAGGKGINVARAIQQVGGKPLVLTTLGGHSGNEIIKAAQRESIELISISTEAGTRQYAVIWDEACEVLTQLSESWSKLTPQEWEAFIGLVTQQMKNNTRFAAATISGRIPSGVRAEEVNSLVKLIMDAKIPCFVDSAGDTLGPLLAANPTAVKINNSEASNYFCQPVNSLHEAAMACKQVVSQGVELCIITMGVHGAVGATKSAAYHVEIDGKGPWPVGSGDSFLAAAAVKWAQGGTLLDIMIAGTAAGTANAHRQIAGLLDMERFKRGLKEARYTEL